MGKDLNRYFTKEDIQMTENHTEKWFISVVSRMYKVKPQRDSTTYAPECLELERPAKSSVERMRNNSNSPVTVN